MYISSQNAEYTNRKQQPEWLAYCFSSELCKLIILIYEVIVLYKSESLIGGHSTCQLQLFKNLTGKGSVQRQGGEDARNKGWREHTWEERFISSQVRSQSSSRGWEETRPATWLLWHPVHSQCLPPSTTTDGNTVTRLTGLPLIHTLLWGILPMPILYLSVNHKKKIQN